jgi:hypothetical protein
VVVGRARLEGGVLEFADRTTTPAVRTTLRDVGVRLEEVGVGPAGGPGRLEAEARVEGGTVRLAGTVEGGTLATRARVRASGLPLSPVRPYLEPALRGVTVPRGSLDAALQVVVAPLDAAGVRVDVDGSVGARDLALALPSARTPSLTSRRLTVELARLRLGPGLGAEIARARVTGATLRVTREPDGRLDLGRLWTTPAPDGDPSPPSARRPFTIRRIELTDGRLEFTDAGVSPAFRESLTDLTVEAQQTSGQPEQMSFRVQGRLGGTGTLDVQGWATPFAGPLRVEGQGGLRDYELSALSAYAARYAGHRIEQGRASAEVVASYDGGRYTADTRLTVHRILLGGEADADLRERLGMSLEHVVSLLEDTSGDIDLRVPITGGADGTRFELRHVVLTALRNTLVKTLTAPFRMFGSVVTRDDRVGEVKIEPIGFTPGTLEPDEEAAARLAEVIAFVQERPRLGLRLRGLVAPAEVEALKRERLQETLRRTPPVPDTPLVAVYRAAGGGAGRSVPPQAEMERFVLERTRITDDDLRALAEQRAQVIQQALVRRGIEPRRLSVLREARALPAAAGAGRVELEIAY